MKTTTTTILTLLMSILIVSLVNLKGHLSEKNINNIHYENNLYKSNNIKNIPLNSYILKKDNEY